MALKIRTWDAAEHLDSPAAIASYLKAAFEDGEPELIAAAIGDVARARGMSDIAKETGLSRESLYRALSADGNPEFVTVIKVLQALGMRLEASPARVEKRRPAKKRTAA
jgi:probable addiction module antidote protein